jgi:hypothetical protein
VAQWDAAEVDIAPPLVLTALVVGPVLESPDEITICNRNTTSLLSYNTGEGYYI